VFAEKENALALSKKGETMLKLAQGICVFALASMGLFVSALSAQTNIPVTVTRTTGLVGIAEGQTAQLNALNPNDSTTCTGLLSFIGDDGTVLKTKSVSVAPGTGMHLTLDSVLDLALAVGVRRDIYGTITLAAAPPTSTGSSTTASTAITAECRLIGTLEIYNTADGHTLVTLATDHREPSPVEPTPAPGS
jgi:hypothetical protein